MQNNNDNKLEENKMEPELNQESNVEEEIEKHNPNNNENISKDNEVKKEDSMYSDLDKMEELENINEGDAIFNDVKEEDIVDETPPKVGLFDKIKNWVKSTFSRDSKDEEKQEPNDNSNDGKDKEEKDKKEKDNKEKKEKENKELDEKAKKENLKKIVKRQEKLKKLIRENQFIKRMRTNLKVNNKEEAAMIYSVHGADEKKQKQGLRQSFESFMLNSSSVSVDAVGKEADNMVKQCMDMKIPEGQPATAIAFKQPDGTYIIAVKGDINKAGSNEVDQDLVNKLMVEAVKKANPSANVELFKVSANDLNKVAEQNPPEQVANKEEKLNNDLQEKLSNELAENSINVVVAEEEKSDVKETELNKNHEDPEINNLNK